MRERTTAAGGGMSLLSNQIYSDSEVLTIYAASQHNQSLNWVIRFQLTLNGLATVDYYCSAENGTVAASTSDRIHVVKDHVSTVSHKTEVIQ